MIVEYLRIAGLRNLDRIDIDVHPHLNWLIGANGAGKTSILESLYLLARGRSFRGRKHGPLIGTRHERLEVGARIRLPASADQSPLPCTSLHYVLTSEQSRLLENGQVVEHLHDRRVPFHVRVIADNAQRLLEGQPEIRRLFLDWNLFHVEPAYGRVFSEFRRVQAQRNAWIKAGGQGPRVWDGRYCQLAEAITQARLRILAGLERGLNLMGERVGYRHSLALRFRPGWDTSRTLDDILQGSIRDDLQRGYTLYGPARADFTLVTDGSHHLPSRGQTKMLVCLLQLAAQHYALQLGSPLSVWLVDDLAAELDVIAQERLLTAMSDLGVQIFITTLTRPTIPMRGLEEGQMFHVEQGRIEHGDSG